MALAYIRPANPVMDYVPQNVGIYDTYYDNFRESDCRYCHGTSTAERHHGNQRARQGDCCFCHFAENCNLAVPPERDCKACHIDSGPIGDFGSPHHKSDLADSGQCDQCHDPRLLVETNTVEPPSYAPSNITPTPYACENCHWPSGNAPDRPPKINDWDNWTGYPVPTYLPDGTPDPQPIESNGPTFSGTKNASKRYRPLEGTHHAVGGKVYEKCYNCHASSPGAPVSSDPNNPYLIRYCENCHDIATLHSIPEHVSDNNIYRVGGIGNTLVTANEKCVACHGDNLLGSPPLPDSPPALDFLEPDFGSPGIVVGIVPVSGSTFDDKRTGDIVEARQVNPPGPWNAVPIYRWTDSLIQIKIPDWTFQPGSIRVRVVKNTTSGIKHSNVRVFSVREHPRIYYLNPPFGNYGDTVTVNGEGFGVNDLQEKIYAPNFAGIRYGWSSYVEFHASNDKYRLTKYNVWTATVTTVKLEDILDVNTGRFISPQELYPGCWNAQVITDYFKDDGDGKYFDYATGSLDTGDDLLYREISDPVCFTITKDPYIDSISPNPAAVPPPGTIKPKTTASIFGANFGPTQGTGKVLIWNKKKTKYKVAKIAPSNWSNTEIEFYVLPKTRLATAKPVIKNIQVVLGVSGPGPDAICGTADDVLVHPSNYYQLTVIGAGP